MVYDECKPYASGVGVNWSCEFSCADPSFAFERYACKQGSAKVLTSHEGIMQELITNSLVKVGFIVYDDFY